MVKQYTTRQRHEAARRRTLTVAEVRQVTPGYLSIRFDCDDFGDFSSTSFDDHVKVFLAGERSAGGKPPMRDYTPRAFDVERGEFTIEFAMHDAGPATDWARSAKVGDTLQIGGPRGSVGIVEGLDWYWLIGDETAIPAILRCIEERPASPILAIITVTGAEEEREMALSDQHRIVWVHRPSSAATDSGPIIEAMAREALPPGEGFVWIASEAGVAKAAREAILARGHPLEQMKARGYWVAGEADSTARFD